MDAAERVAATNYHQPPSSNYSSKSLPREAKRKEPLGQANSSETTTKENNINKNG